MSDKWKHDNWHGNQADRQRCGKDEIASCPWCRIAELESQNQWQPIETAPKDGTRFMAWDFIHHQRLFTMHWDDGEFITENEPWSGRFFHWTPLPEPPNG